MEINQVSRRYDGYSIVSEYVFMRAHTTQDPSVELVISTWPKKCLLVTSLSNMDEQTRLVPLLAQWRQKKARLMVVYPSHPSPKDQRKMLIFGSIIKGKRRVQAMLPRESKCWELNLILIG